MAQEVEADLIYISFSPKDKKWKRKLCAHLQPYVQSKSLRTWDVTQPQAGEDANQERTSILQQAKVAVLLVSSDYLGSKIFADEMPLLSKLVQDKQLLLRWILIRPCIHDSSGLDPQNALGDIKHPLSSLNKSDADNALTEVTKQLISLMERQDASCGSLNEGRSIESGSILRRSLRRYWKFAALVAATGVGSVGLLFVGLLAIFVLISDSDDQTNDERTSDTPEQNTKRSLAGSVIKSKTEPVAILPMACRPELNSNNYFIQKPGIRVLVALYQGADSASRDFGVLVAQRLVIELPKFLRGEISTHGKNPGLAASDVQVASAQCIVYGGHEEARRMGANSGADVVIWGATVTTPGAGSTFNTSVTVVRWRGLNENQAQSVHLMNPSTLLDMNFPQFAIERPLALIKLVLGIYAHEKTYYVLAASYFEKITDDVIQWASESAKLYRFIGFSYLSAGETKKGVEALQKAVQQCEANDHECSIVSLTSLASAYLFNGQSKKYLEIYKDLLARPLSVGEFSDAAYAIGIFSYLLQDYDNSQKFFEMSLKLSRGFPSSGAPNDKTGKIALKRDGRASPLLEISSIAALSSIQLKKKNAIEAERLLQVALRRTQEINDIVFQGTILRELGDLNKELNHSEQALTYFQQSEDLLQKTGAWHIRSMVLNDLALAYSAMGNHRKALEALGIALELTRKIHRVDGQSTTLYNLSLECRALKQLTVALDYAKQAWQIISHEGSLEMKVATLTLLADLYIELGNRNDASVCLKNAFMLHKKLNKSRKNQELLYDIADLLANLGDSSSSKEAYEIYINAFDKETSLDKLAIAYTNLALIQEELGQKDQAIETYGRAIDKLSSSNAAQKQLAMVMMSQARALERQQRQPEAIYSYKRSAEIYFAQSENESGVFALESVCRLASQFKESVECGLALADLRKRKLSLIAQLLEARLLSWQEGAAAIERYQQINIWAKSLTPDMEKQINLITFAGITRIRNSRFFSGCFGLLLMDVPENSQAAHIGLKAGDIIIKNSGQCLIDPADLEPRLARRLKSVPMVFLREGYLRTVSRPPGQFDGTLVGF